LYVPEFANIYTGEEKLEDLKVGDWLSYISVVINSNQAEVRVIRVGKKP